MHHLYPPIQLAGALCDVCDRGLSKVQSLSSFRRSSAEVQYCRDRIQETWILVNLHESQIFFVCYSKLSPGAIVVQSVLCHPWAAFEVFANDDEVILPGNGFVARFILQPVVCHVQFSEESSLPTWLHLSANVYYHFSKCAEICTCLECAYFRRTAVNAHSCSRRARNITE